MPVDRPSTKQGLITVTLIALALRAIILALDAVPFNADEAVVGLMARHTLQGNWPAFFYGQSYMGSLDATLIAAAFALLGESVLAIRLVQTALYLGIILTTYWLGIRFYANRWSALAAAALMSIPSVLVSTYTTATLGGYGEVLLLGNLILLVGHAVLTDWPGTQWHWLSLGALAGLGFWTLALVLVYLAPIALLALVRYVSHAERRRPVVHLAFMVGAFLLFSGPWWWHNLHHNWSALQFAVTGTESSGIGIGTVPLGTRLAGLALLGIPALLGLRFPWSPDALFGIAAAVPLSVYLGVALFTAVDWRQRRDPSRSLLLGVLGAFVAMFLFTRFGTDATGRYFLPLAAPLALWCGNALVDWERQRTHLGKVALIILLATNLASNCAALVQIPPGLTTQFDPSNRFDNRHDHALIRFLQSLDIQHGYTNYFVAFRIAFLSGEQIVLAPQLPYKPDMSYNPADNRYPAYTQAVDAADQVVLITSIHPTLDQLLAERLDELGVGFTAKDIGAYHIFYGLTRRVAPAELGFGHP